MEILSAIVLGIIQGLTEFLPISSSAHLILVPWFFGWEPGGLVFDVALHVGTALAVLAFFARDWIRLAREVVLGLKERAPLGNADRKLAWLLVVGTIPAMIAGFCLEEVVESRLRSPLVTVFTLAGLALLLWVAERRGRQDRSMESYSWGDAVWIGIGQAIALVPGVSRSGITMTTALLRHSDRVSAARFSFLLSTPVIAGAGFLQAYRLLASGDGGAGLEWPVLLAGMVAAAVTGFLCIRFLLRYLVRNSFTPFVIYRLVLAAVVLAFYLKG
ncbi:MAG: undecaprenyl-diphosphate phosphatase [Acidobacteriota bacterium]|jgi:undecaprenyl-diphosphatase|nr:undecaprenyl-diphosphate phosphatase [Acidobacteriota bacterium]NLT32241.1 undecaprenyl-diphosphate phosphatase [Acidobacteriota bacterium]